MKPNVQVFLRSRSLRMAESVPAAFDLSGVAEVLRRRTHVLIKLNLVNASPPAGPPRRSMRRGGRALCSLGMQRRRDHRRLRYAAIRHLETDRCLQAARLLRKWPIASGVNSSIRTMRTAKARRPGLHGFREMYLGRDTSRERPCSPGVPAFAVRHGSDRRVESRADRPFPQ